MLGGAACSLDTARLLGWTVCSLDTARLLGGPVGSLDTARLLGGPVGSLDTAPLLGGAVCSLDTARLLGGTVCSLDSVRLLGGAVGSLDTARLLGGPVGSLDTFNVLVSFVFYQEYLQIFMFQKPFWLIDFNLLRCHALAFEKKNNEHTDTSGSCPYFCFAWSVAKKNKTPNITDKHTQHKHCIAGVDSHIQKKRGKQNCHHH